MSVPVADATTAPSTTTFRQVSPLWCPPPTQAVTNRRSMTKSRLVSVPVDASGSPVPRKLYDVTNRPLTFSSVRTPNGRRNPSGVSAAVTGPAPKASPVTVQPSYVGLSQVSNRMSGRSVNTIASQLRCPHAPVLASTISIRAVRPT